MLIDDVKLALRVGSSSLDSEVIGLILAAKSDLKLAGIKEEKILDDDPVIKQAIIIYCKANFGFIDDSEKYRKSFESLKNTLALSSDYGVHQTVQE